MMKMGIMRIIRMIINNGNTNDAENDHNINYTSNDVKKMKIMNIIMSMMIMITIHHH